MRSLNTNVYGQIQYDWVQLQDRIDATAIQTQVNILLANIDAQTPAAIEQAAAIGAAAQSAQAAYCGTGSSLSTQDVCTKLNAAVTIGAGDASNIGKSLLNLLKP